MTPPTSWRISTTNPIRTAIADCPTAATCHATDSSKPTWSTSGEALPDGALEKSYRLATQADELWVIGSTLEVMPAASIVPIAAEAGVPITIMNMGRTQYDRLADRLIHDDIAVALPQLVDETITAEQ